MLKLLELSNADFICLQEVTKTFMELLYNLGSESWAKNYFMSSVPMGRYHDTLILSKYKCKFYRIPYSKKTDQKRTMLFAELFINHKTPSKQIESVIIGCMHYESDVSNKDIREKQV